MQVTPHGGLANRCTRPLCDLSVAAAAGILSWGTAADRLRPAGRSTDARRRPPQAPDHPDRQRAGGPSALPRDRASTSSARASIAGASSSASSRSRRRSTPRRSSTSSSTTRSSSTCRRSRRRRPGSSRRRRPRDARSSRSGRSPASSTAPASVAVAAGDHRGHQFLQWFIEEQVEEESKLQRDRRPHRQRHQPVPGGSAARRVRVAPWRPTRDDEIRAARVGDSGPPGSTGRSTWPSTTRRGPASTIVRPHGSGRPSAQRVLRLEHVGSTSIPGLAAKPIIDIVLVVADSADEAAYVPALEAAGYVLRIREPGWFEHRVLNGPDTKVNLHVFSDGCPEIGRMLAFRDRLRTRRRRAPALRGDEARTRRARLGLRPGLRRRQERGRRGDHRAGHGRALTAPPRVDIGRASRYRPGTHMNHHFYFRCPA